ncbi:hypothetical protein N3K66_003525 [Trichothecium roseum]|uniref:Uncharacterized protein n=1 Tax=Trichothecium roseum TaxID=47278 RepID=A0ACC0V667_9HYPO|nr:hypothetical protein N3K66_003525 [Trichothecium roseum]
MADFSDAHRGRIIKHMNNEHRASLTAYLRHYAGLPEPAASRSPELVDLAPDRMVIRTSDGADHAVALDPPLASVSEFRARLVEMDAVARAGLGEKVTIKGRYEFPTGFPAVVFALVSFYFASYAALPRIVPGTAAWDLLAAYFPGGAGTFCWLVDTIFWPVVGIHSVEAVLFDRTRLSRYGIPRFGGLWWKWMLNVFIEGAPAFGRFEAMAQREIKSH